MVPAPSATDIDRLGQENDFIFPADGAHPYKRDLTDLEFHLLDTGHLVLEDKAYEVFPHEFPQPQARRADKWTAARAARVVPERAGRGEPVAEALLSAWQAVSTKQPSAGASLPLPALKDWPPDNRYRRIVCARVSLQTYRIG
jgi:hypothetical protein